MNKLICSFLIYLLSNTLVLSQDILHDHPHEIKNSVFPDSSIAINIISSNQNRFIELFGFKNRLHQYNYQANYNKSNWMSYNFAPLFNTSDKLNLDSNTVSNFRYSFGLFEDHLLDINYNQPINQSTILLDFSTTNSGNNYVHSAINNFRFRAAIIDTTGNFGYKIHFVNNRWKIKENGGIKDLNAIDQIDDLSSVAYGSFLQTATNEIDYQKLDFNLFTHLFNFNKSDSSKSNYGINLLYGFDYLYEGYKFEMAERDIDSLFYSSTLIDTTYTRDSVGNRGWSPKLALNLSTKRINVKVQYKKDYFANEILNEEQIDGNLDLSFKRFKLQNNINYRVAGLWQNGYTIQSKLVLDSIGDGILTTSFLQEDLLPSFFYQNYFGNHFSWNNQLNNQNVTELEASYLYLPYHLKIGTRFSNYINYTYLNELSSPSQEANVLISRIEIGKDIKLKNLSSFNEIGIQNSNNDVIRIPSFYLRTSQAFHYKILGMPISSGFSLLYLTKHKGLAYNPNLRNYYLQNNQNVGGFPLLDLFFGVKAGGADLFVKIQNVLYSLGNRSDFLVYENVLTIPTMIRVGFNWKFSD